MSNKISARHTNDESVYDSLPISIVKTDLDGKIIYVNEAFTISSGYSRDEVINKKPTILKSGEMPSDFYKDMWDTIISGKNWNGRVCNKKKSGTFYWQDLKITPVYNNKHIDHYVAIGLDVTKDFMTINILNEKNITNDKIFSLMPNTVYIFDIFQNKSMYYNKMLSTLTGYTQDELFDSATSMIELLIHPDDISKFMIHIENVKRGNVFKNTTDVHSLEYRLVGKYGDIIYIIDKQTPFKINESGVVEQIMGVVIDISEIKEKHRIIENSNMIKDRLLSIIAHDIKNPFQAILGYSELISQSCESDTKDDLELYVSKISEVVFNTDEMLTNVISWVRVNTLNINTIKIKLDDFAKYVVSRYINLLELKKINLEINIDSDLYIYADEYMSHSIIGNLLTNAIKFTNSGGNISISAKLQNSDRIVIEVSDDGIGMDNDMINSILNAEFVANVTVGTDGEKGTGLGMSICKEFIKKHNGRIRIHSNPGTGSTISFDLPGFKKL